MKKYIGKGFGFTIIEMVIVIAIIGILSFAVLINVKNYINRSKDTRMKSNMHTLQVQANLDNPLSNRPYNTNIVCDPNKAWKIVRELDPGAKCMVNRDDPSGTVWCACAKELSKEDTYYCVDSTGKAVETQIDCRSNSSASYCGSWFAIKLVCPTN